MSRLVAIAAFMVATFAGCSSSESITAEDNDFADAGPDAAEVDGGICAVSDDKGELGCTDGGP